VYRGGLSDACWRQSHLGCCCCCCCCWRVLLIVIPAYWRIRCRMIFYSVSLSLCTAATAERCSWNRYDCGGRKQVGDCQWLIWDVISMNGVDCRVILTSHSSTVTSSYLCEFIVVLYLFSLLCVMCVVSS